MNERNASNTSSAPDAAKGEISFVTKKVLVTFRAPIALLINDSAVYTQAAICEYTTEEKPDRYSDHPKHLTIVALPDGKKLTRSLELTLGYEGVFASVEL